MSGPVVQVESESPAAMLWGVEVEVVARHQQACDVASLTLALPSREALPECRPGAHVDVVMTSDLVRQYSVYEVSPDGTSWSIAVLREPDGRGGSEWMHAHAVEGTRLQIRGPRNNFVLAPARRYIFVAGGIGITPLLPMMAEVNTRGGHFDLWYGGRSRSSMAFLDRLADYRDRVTLWPEDERGMLDLDVMLSEPADGVLVYCCGPAGLIDAVEKRCATWPEHSLRVERFVPKTPAAPTGPDGPIEVVCARSGVIVGVPADVTILEALEKAGVNVLSSCTEGICGTCVTTVLEGRPDHRDSVLTDEEREASDCITVCVSRALGERLVLDV